LHCGPHQSRDAARVSDADSAIGLARSGKSDERGLLARAKATPCLALTVKIDAEDNHVSEGWIGGCLPDDRRLGAAGGAPIGGHFHKNRTAFGLRGGEGCLVKGTEISSEGRARKRNCDSDEEEGASYQGHEVSRDGAMGPSCW